MVKIKLSLIKGILSVILQEGMKSDHVALDVGNMQEMFSNCWKRDSVLEGRVCSKNMHSRMHVAVSRTRG